MLKLVGDPETKLDVKYMMNIRLEPSNKQHEVL